MMKILTLGKKQGDLPKIAETIWDTRFFKPVSSVVTYSRATSAFSACWIRTVFSLAQASLSVVKMVFNFSASDTLNWNFDSAFLVSVSWAASRVLASDNWVSSYVVAACIQHKLVKFDGVLQNTSPMCFASNNTWHLGANVCQRISLSKMALMNKVPSTLQARLLGTWGLMHIACIF